MTVNILGTDYEIHKETYTSNPEFSKMDASGYVELYAKKIHYCDMSTFKGWEDSNYKSIQEAEKQSLRHEIVHAFLFESGLNDDSAPYDGGWATNEEMVDWFAINGPKIMKAWGEAQCL